MRQQIQKAKRIIFKISSSTVLDDQGRLDGPVLHRLAALWAQLHREGRDIVIVSSGAIGLGWPVPALPQPVHPEYRAPPPSATQIDGVNAYVFEASHYRWPSFF